MPLIIRFQRFLQLAGLFKILLPMQRVGSADFMFKALDPAGQPNAIDITNSQNLSFTMTYAGGNLSTDNFLLAGEAVSSDLVLGAGQLGAHLQSLSTAGCSGCSDSGFAFGNYTSSITPVPEPSVFMLLSTGLLGWAGYSLRKAKSQFQA